MRRLRCADRLLTFEHPQIMGVLNITPDSFSDGGQLFGKAKVRMQQVVARAESMLSEGAQVLDVGGESTRPGAVPVSGAEELRRVIPVVAALAGLDTIISVDTRHADVASAAIKAGAHLINDVSAGKDPDMLRVIAETGVGYALMHMQGTPQTMQNAPGYADVVLDVHAYLGQRVAACLDAGIDPSRLMVDPGFGFGKTVQHNLALLRRLPEVRVDNLPLLVGLSRKSSIGAITGRAVQERIHGSVAAALLAVDRDADLLRVHDVGATMDALKMYRAVKTGL